MGRWSAFLRTLVAIGWVVVALLTVSAATRREGSIDQLVKGQAAERERFRSLATSEILSALLRPGTKGTPAAYTWSVYLPNEANQLVPSFPSTPDSAIQTFESGCGATGIAFRDRGPLIVVTDDAVSDETHGLTDAQQRYFREYKAVVATPIWVSDRVIGVLTAISKVNDGYFATAAGGPVIRELATMVGVVLTNISGLDGVE